MKKVFRYEAIVRTNGTVAKSDLDLGRSVSAMNQQGLGAIENHGNLWPVDVFENHFKKKPTAKDIVKVTIASRTYTGVILGPEKGKTIGVIKLRGSD